MNKKAITLTELIFAVGILVTCIVPIVAMFQTSGHQLQKSHNFTFATSLARNISQKLMAIPYEDIVEIPLPGIQIADGPDDFFFNPLLNFGPTSDTEKRITAEQMPELYNFIKIYGFRYSISVSNVGFNNSDDDDDDDDSDGSMMKSVSIMITWKENNREMMYRMHTYVNQ